MARGMARAGATGLVLAWLALATPTWAADRALLVGLERYGDPRVNPTPGGAEDARSVARTLETSFGFSKAGIRVLLDAEATSGAIVRQFREWLIEGTGPGDRVFFLYAGHGSQLADQNGDEADGYDETLAPYDVDPVTGDRQIRDDVIDSLIAQLTGRRAVLLFDSCHSGTLTRGLIHDPAALGGQGVRYLPRPDQLVGRREGLRGVSGQHRGYRIEAARGGEQRAFDAPEKMGRMTGIIAISAAGPGQLAYPVDVDGTPRGALSYLFEEAVSSSSRGGLFGNLKGSVLKSAESTLKKTTNTAVKAGLDGTLAKASAQDLQQGVTIAGLEEVIDSGMKRLQASGRLEGNQRPWFEVLSEQPIEEQPLFGDDLQAAEVAMSNPIDDRQVTLRTVGDEVLFHRGDELVFEAWTDSPGYLYLLVFSEGERATCIFPNPSDRSNRIDRGKLRIPTHDRYRLPVQEPFGRDLVVAVVADERMELCEKIDYTWNEIFARVELDEVHQRLRERVERGIGFEATGPVDPAEEPPAATAAGASPVTAEPLSWQTAVLVLHTVDTAPGDAP